MSEKKKKKEIERERERGKKRVIKSSEANNRR